MDKTGTGVPNVQNDLSALSFLGLTDSVQLKTHYLRGALLENLIVAEYVKRKHHEGRPPRCYFWRDKSGNEVDLLIDNKGKLTAIEIKYGTTIRDNFFKNSQEFFRKTVTSFMVGKLICRERMQKCVDGKLSLRIVLSDITYAKASRIGRAFSIRAFRFGLCITAQISFLLCRFSQKSGVFSSTLASSRAVSTVTARLPVQSSLTVLRLTPIACASCP